MNIVEHGTGTPLVLIHGIPVDHRDLLPLDLVLAKAGGWERLYLDLPFTQGTSGEGIDSTEDVYATVATALRDRLGEQPFAVLGVSYGAMIARRLAHEFDNVLGLATLVGVYVADHAARTVPPRTVLHQEPAIHDLPDYPRYAQVAVAESVEGHDRFTTYALPGIASADAEVVERIGTAYAFDVEPDDTNPPFTQPTLILTGRQDHIVGYNDAWARLDQYPRATFLTLDGGGHSVYAERAPLVEAAILDWLDRIRQHSRSNDGGQR